MNRKILSFSLSSTEAKAKLHLLLYFVIIFLVYLIINYACIYVLSLQNIRSYVSKSANTVAHDIEYVDGKWDTSKYLSDISTPTEVPFYVYSSDGFLIDRLNMIHGLLDTSNYQYASSFTTPMTFTSPINESWRAFSYPVRRNNDVVGVILLAFFDPANRPTKDIDTLLIEDAKKLDGMIVFTEDGISSSQVVAKTIDPNISFEIVKPDNQSILTYGGPPSYIDPSYVYQILEHVGYQYFTDTKTHQRYLVYSMPIVSEGKSVGVVVVGKSLNQLGIMLYTQAILSLIAGIIAIIVYAIIVFSVFRTEITTLIEERIVSLTQPQIIQGQTLSYDPNTCTIVVNGEINIQIPPDTYQSMMCKLFFKNPQKHYDSEAFRIAVGEQDEMKNMSRPFYDAVESINSQVIKVIGKKLILHKNKAYFIHPEIASKIV